MNSFVYENPTRIVFGPGSISKLEKEAKKLGIKKALIVIGQGSIKKNGFLAKVTNQLTKISVSYEIFEGISPNPSVAQIDSGAQYARKNKVDSIIALGGGSVMDSAKVIALLALQEGSAWDYTSTPFQKGKAVQGALPLITIPTLAGTGSEADPIAVVNNPETNEKKSISGYALFPKVALIDPELTITSSIKTSLDGAFDILSHSAETYFSTKDFTPIQDGITETIWKTVLMNVLKIKENPFDVDARSQISWASSIAMAGFLTGRNGGWPMHAIEHQISGLYSEISHGSGLAAVFLPVIEWNVRHTGMERLKRFLRNVFQFEPKTLEDASEFLLKFMKDYGFYTNLKRLGVRKEDLGRIAQSVLAVKGNKENKLVNIADMSLNDIEAILRRAYEI